MAKLSNAMAEDFFKENENSSNNDFNFEDGDHMILSDHIIEKPNGKKGAQNILKNQKF